MKEKILSKNSIIQVLFLNMLRRTLERYMLLLHAFQGQSQYFLMYSEMHNHHHILEDSNHPKKKLHTH